MLRFEIQAIQQLANVPFGGDAAAALRFGRSAMLASEKKKRERANFIDGVPYR